MTLPVADLDALRERGVKSFERFENGNFKVEFFPPSAAPGSPPAAMPDVEGERPCACGHRLDEHGGQGLCLLGCAAERCSMEDGE